MYLVQSTYSLLYSKADDDVELLTNRTSPTVDVSAVNLKRSSGLLIFTFKTTLNTTIAQCEHSEVLDKKKVHVYTYLLCYIAIIYVK